jgi:hypothetical protein
MKLRALLNLVFNIAAGLICVKIAWASLLTVIECSDSLLSWSALFGCTALAILCWLDSVDIIRGDDA